ncbi:MAG: hypothetical protein A2V99_01890 [Spirochaetes bacterium RBG_16_67_19]|nr:MAG: hypothetical protein A2V99_01890 [Spirochaetes bacterium RBG_16_67_19]
MLQEAQLGAARQEVGRAAAHLPLRGVAYLGPHEGPPGGDPPAQRGVLPHQFRHLRGGGAVCGAQVPAAVRRQARQEGQALRLPARPGLETPNPATRRAVVGLVGRRTGSQAQAGGAGAQVLHDPIDQLLGHEPEGGDLAAGHRPDAAARLPDAMAAAGVACAQGPAPRRGKQRPHPGIAGQDPVGTEHSGQHLLQQAQGVVHFLFGGGHPIQLAVPADRIVGVGAAHGQVAGPEGHQEKQHAAAYRHDQRLARGGLAAQDDMDAFGRAQHRLLPARQSQQKVRINPRGAHHRVGRYPVLPGLRAGILVAEARPDHPPGGVFYKTGHRGLVGHRGPGPGRGVDHLQGEPGIVHQPVPVGPDRLERAAQERDVRQRPGRVQHPPRGRIVVAGQLVVAGQDARKGAGVELRSVGVGGQEELHRPGQVGARPEQPLALQAALGHQLRVVHHVAQPGVHHLGADAAGARGEVGAFQQRHGKPAQGAIPGDARPRDPPADHQDLEVPAADAL